MDINQLKKLNRLNKIRVKRCEKQLAESKDLFHEACRKVDKRKLEISVIKNENNDLNTHLKKNYVSKSPVKREHVHIRRFWLNYDLEMHEYYYDQEIDEKSTTQSKYQESKNVWYKQKLKAEKLNNFYNSLSKERFVISENVEDEINQESKIK